MPERIEIKTTHHITGSRIINVLTYIICDREKSYSFTKRAILVACREYLKVIGTKGVDIDMLEDFKDHPDFIKNKEKAGAMTRRLFPELFKEPSSILFIKSLDGEEKTHE